MNLLHRLGLSDEDARKPVGTYSGGMKRQLGQVWKVCKQPIHTLGVDHLYNQGSSVLELPSLVIHRQADISAISALQPNLCIVRCFSWMNHLRR